MTWSDGERVEGYTDLLWVLLIGAAGKLGADYIIAARVLDFVGVVGAIVVLGISPRTGRWLPARLLASGPLMALSVPLAVWGIGGLEHGFMALVLVLSLLTVSRRALSEAAPGRADLVAGLPLAMLALLRADAVVLVGSLLAGSVLATRNRRVAFLRATATAIPTVLGCTAQLAFRRAYYGEWQPNTALAKLAFNTTRLGLGFDYLRAGYGTLIVLALCALLGTWLLRNKDLHRESFTPWAVVVTWSLYLLVVGGDIFPGYRQLVFVVVALGAVVASAAEAVSPNLKVQGAFVLAGLAHLIPQVRAPENVRAKNELWEWAGLPVGSALRTAFGAQRPLLAVDAAGALPYWSELPSLDMLGLNDRFIAHHPPPNFGTGQIGHELGDGAYVWSRKPDLIAFNNAAGARDPMFLSGRQLLAMPQFHQTYQWIRVQGNVGGTAFGEIWLRREGSELGIIRNSNAIRIPGYLFTGQASPASAMIASNGRLVAMVSKETPGEVPGFTVGPGRFRMRLIGEPFAYTSGFRCNGVSMSRMAVGAEPVIELRHAEAVGIALEPHDGVRALSGVELLRVDDAPTFRCTSRSNRVVLAFSDIAERKRENTYWAQPGNSIIDRSGLTVHFDGVQRPKSVELSVDNDDTYVFEALLKGQTVFSRRIEWRANGGGLAVHELTLNASDAPAGFDEIRITPSGGDGNYAVGHVHLEN